MDKKELKKRKLSEGNYIRVGVFILLSEMCIALLHVSEYVDNFEAIKQKLFKRGWDIRPIKPKYQL